MADTLPVPAPLSLERRATPGGIPVFQGSMVKIINKPRLNFDNEVPTGESTERLWFGPMEFEVAGDLWYLKKSLSFGAEGQTYLAVQKSTGRRLVAKFCIEKKSTEVDLVAKLPPDLVRHPNLTKYEFIIKDVTTQFYPAHHVILMEQVPNGELFDFIISQEPSAKGKPISPGTSRRFLRDVISGMTECYRFALTHRDLKPENLLIDEEGRVVIIDLGHAKPAVKPEPGHLLEPMSLERFTTTHAYGTPAFNAPEVGNCSARGIQYDCEKADIWSVGVIAFTLHAKLPAFEKGGGICRLEDVFGDNTRFWQKIDNSPYYKPKFPDELKAFINALWRQEPRDRPKFSQLAQVMDGDAATLEQFPGLAWLAESPNDIEEFAEELKMTSPGMMLRLGKTACVDLTGQYVAGNGEVWNLVQEIATGTIEKQGSTAGEGVLYTVEGSSVVVAEKIGDLDGASAGTVSGPDGDLTIAWSGDVNWRQQQPHAKVAVATQ